MTLLFAYLLPLLLPTALYMLWRLWRGRAATAGRPAGEEVGGEAAVSRGIDWRDAPWLALALAGVVLLAAVLLIGVFDHRPAPPERYVPPRIQDGQIVPGELRPESPAPGGPGAESGGRSGTGGP